MGRVADLCRQVRLQSVSVLLYRHFMWNGNTPTIIPTSCYCNLGKPWLYFQLIVTRKDDWVSGEKRILYCDFNIASEATTMRLPIVVWIWGVSNIDIHNVLPRGGPKIESLGFDKGCVSKLLPFLLLSSSTIFSIVQYPLLAHPLNSPSI